MDVDQQKPAVWPAVLAVVLVLTVHVIGRVGCYCSPIRSDSYTYAAFAFRMLHGDVLYRDMSVDKPPGLMVLHALAYLVLPAARWSLIPLESLLMLGGYAAVYALARELYGRGPALILSVAAAVSINYFSTMDFTGEGFGLAESTMILPHAFGVLLYLRAVRRRRPSYLVAAGACVGISLAIKQTALPLVGAIVLHAVVRRLVGGRSLRGAAADGARVLLGVALGLAPFALMLVVQGTVRAGFREMTTNAAELLTRETAWPASWRDVTPLWTPLIWLGLLPVAGLPSGAQLRIQIDRWLGLLPVAGPPSGDRQGGPARSTVVQSLSSPGISLLLVWQLLECLLLVVLPRRSYHYYVLSFMPLILLSGLFWLGVSGLLDHQEKRTTSTVMAALLLWSAASIRPAVNEFVPVSFARWSLFDSVAEQVHFETVVRLDNGSLGANDGKWPGE